MEDVKYLNAIEVAVLVGTSIQTLNSWYKWKRTHPEHELAKLLPDFERGDRRTRYWKSTDVWKIIEFKTNIPVGRNGIMGDVTQKYTKKN